MGFAMFLDTRNGRPARVAWKDSPARRAAIRARVAEDFGFARGFVLRNGKIGCEGGIGIGANLVTLTESNFERVADAALSEIAAAIESRLDDRLDVEFEAGILTIELEDGGRYHINKHAPNRQIWLSSPKSGAWHFAASGPDGGWVSTRDARIGLGALLNREIEAATGIDPGLKL